MDWRRDILSLHHIVLNVMFLSKEQMCQQQRFVCTFSIPVTR